MTENNTLGFLSIDIRPDHQELIDHINNLSSLRPFNDCVLFNNNYNHLYMYVNNFYTLHINEAKYFKGPIVVFDDISCDFLLNCISKQKILWMQEPIKDKKLFLNNYDVNYRKYSLLDTIICEDIETYNILKTLWKEPILLTEIDYEKILSNIQL
jgi:hypothetical protein